MDKILTLDFLTTRRNQAQKDLEMYDIMIQEIESLVSNKDKVDKHIKFLKVVTNSGDKENENKNCV